MTWREMELGDCMTIKHGFAFKGEHFAESGQRVVLTPGNFHEAGGFRARPGKDRFYAIEPPEDYILKGGDLVVAMTEQGEGLLGSSALIPDEGCYLHNQRIGLVENLHDQALDKKFLYYLFNTRAVRAQIRASATGGKVRHTAPRRICAVRVRVPSVEVQRRIADVISGYGDLIENNRRRISLLEELARLLYREWFIHLRFPSHEHVKVVDGVPEGWSTFTFGEVCEAVGGGTPSTENAVFWNDGDIPWYTPTDITRNSCLALLDSEKKITDAGLRGSSAKMLPSGTVLMTSRASVGFFGVINVPSCTNQGFISVIPHEPSARMYLLHNLMHRVEEIRTHAGGATYKEISKGKFKGLPVVLPQRELLRDFEEQVSTLHAQVLTLHSTNRKLSEARDLLLPRLMSGEIAV